MNQNMKIEKGFTFLTETGNLLFIYKKFKNGKMYAYELSNGIKNVIYNYNKKDNTPQVTINKFTDYDKGIKRCGRCDMEIDIEDKYCDHCCSPQPPE